MTVQTNDRSREATLLRFSGEGSPRIASMPRRVALLPIGIVRTDMSQDIAIQRAEKLTAPSESLRTVSQR
jgi:hypothetical protein